MRWILAEDYGRSLGIGFAMGILLGVWLVLVSFVLFKSGSLSRALKYGLLSTGFGLRGMCYPAEEGYVLYGSVYAVFNCARLAGSGKA